MLFKEREGTVKIKVTVKHINRFFNNNVAKWMNTCENLTFFAFVEINYTRIEEIKIMPLESIIDKFYEDFEINGFFKIPCKSQTNEIYFTLIPKTDVISIKIEKG